jgi:hypothetical protein
MWCLLASNHNTSINNAHNLRSVAPNEEREEEAW